MRDYRSRKFHTVAEIIRRISNWPEALGLRLARNKPGLHLLRFRNGDNIILRGACQDWNVMHELYFAGGYAEAQKWLREQKGGVVLDCGGNIGLFTLLATKANPQVTVVTFEPGPQNMEVLKMNLLANPGRGGRVTPVQAAIGGTSGQAEWFFNEANPGGSSLYARQGRKLPVRLIALSEILSELSEPIALLKIDIEGSEYDVLRGTPEEVWKKVPAIALEVHTDPTGRSSPTEFLQAMRSLGYHVIEESVVSYFLHR